MILLQFLLFVIVLIIILYVFYIGDIVYDKCQKINKKDRNLIFCFGVFIKTFILKTNKNIIDEFLKGFNKGEKQ